MKLTVKTLKGTHFQIVVQPSETIMAVKKTIEEIQGKDNYPCGQQLLICNGKVLKDESTLEENNVTEDRFLVVMLSKSKPSSTIGASSASQPSSTAEAPQPAPIEAPLQAPVSTDLTSCGERTTMGISSDAYGQAASNLVAETNLEPTVQQLIDMGSGNWSKDEVVRALRAAYNNPERAVEYLYSGIPETAEVAVPVAPLPSNQASSQEAITTQLPNSSLLNMFPEEVLSTGAGAGAGAGAGGGSFDFLRNNQQFQTLRAMVQANPQILQPVLQELSRQNPQMLRLIQEHRAEFLHLINEPIEGDEGDLFDQPEQEMPHAINVTPAEQEAIDRLEAMGFDRARVIEAFLACDRDEELAANYLLEHAGDED